MRILLVTMEVPFPPVSGHRLHLWSLVRALADEDHELALVSFAQPGESAQDLGPLHRLVDHLDLVPVATSIHPLGESLRRLLALRVGRPYGAVRYASPAMAECVRERLACSNFDAVICDEIYPIVNLPKHLTVPVIADTQHVAYLLLQRYAQHLRNPLARLYFRVEAEKMRKWEARLCRQVAAVGACSEFDGELFRQLCPGVRTVSIPNVVDVDAYQPGAQGEGDRLLYCGALDWYPNQDAVTYFVSEILPGIRERVPDARLVVAGRSPSEVFKRKFAPSTAVEFTGTVPDMRPQFARAAVFVVPLRIAGGTRIKILEAAAMAQPIVSTRIGAEGLDFIDGKEIVLADDPRDFAAAVAGLLTDPVRRRALGQAARRRVDQQYGLAALRSAIGEALEEVTGSRSANYDLVSRRQSVIDEV